MFVNRLKGYARQAVARGIQQLLENPQIKRSLDIFVERHWRVKAAASGNPLIQCGDKYYSQNDEDGIISAIFARLHVDAGVFVEYGCGDGLENNSVHLLMRGWRGVWIGDTDLRIRIPPTSRRLHFERQRVTTENCLEILHRGLQDIGADHVNLISVDVDGNDWFFVEALLEAGVTPDVFVVEYNGKFPPPIRFVIDYDPSYVWSGTDYCGASLQSFTDLFGRFGFRLVCCNVTGANAFFVSARYTELFADVPTDIGLLFMRPDYNWFVQVGHPADPRSIEHFLAESDQ